MPRNPLARSPRAVIALLAATLAVAVAPSAAAQQTPRAVATSFGYVDRGAFSINQEQSAYPPFTPAPRTDTAEEPADEEEKSGLSFDLGVATHVPLFVGGEATLELPHGFLLQGDVGALPTGFVSAVDSALVGVNAYGQPVSEIVRGTLENSLVARVSAGIRPFENHGLELLGGYTLTSLGGGLSARQAIEAATGETLPAELGDARVPISTTIHSVHASLGWRWVLADHLVLRASVGYLQALSSTSRVDLPEGVVSTRATEAALAATNTLVDETLNDVYTRHLKLPVFGLSASWRF